MWRINGAPENTERVFIKAHVIDAAAESALIEETNNYFLAVNCGQHADTQIHLLAGNTDAETSVLRKTAFGDVQTGENFDTRCNGELESLGRRSPS